MIKAPGARTNGSLKQEALMQEALMQEPPMQAMMQALMQALVQEALMAGAVGGAVGAFMRLTVIGLLRVSLREWSSWSSRCISFVHKTIECS